MSTSDPRVLLDISNSPCIPRYNFLGSDYTPTKPSANPRTPSSSLRPLTKSKFTYTKSTSPHLKTYSKSNNCPVVQAWLKTQHRATPERKIEACICSNPKLLKLHSSEVVNGRQRVERWLRTFYESHTRVSLGNVSVGNHEEQGIDRVHIPLTAVNLAALDEKTTLDSTENAEKAVLVQLATALSLLHTECPTSQAEPDVGIQPDIKRYEDLDVAPTEEPLALSDHDQTIVDDPVKVVAVTTASDFCAKVEQLVVDLRQEIGDDIVISTSRPLFERVQEGVRDAKNDLISAASEEESHASLNQENANSEHEVDIVTITSASGHQTALTHAETDGETEIDLVTATPKAVTPVDLDQGDTGVSREMDVLTCSVAHAETIDIMHGDNSVTHFTVEPKAVIDTLKYDVAPDPLSDPETVALRNDVDTVANLFAKTDIAEIDKSTLKVNIPQKNENDDKTAGGIDSVSMNVPDRESKRDKPKKSVSFAPAVHVRMYEVAIPSRPKQSSRVMQRSKEGVDHDFDRHLNTLSVPFGSACHVPTSVVRSTPTSTETSSTSPDCSMTTEADSSLGENSIRCSDNHDKGDHTLVNGENQEHDAGEDTSHTLGRDGSVGRGVLRAEEVEAGFEQAASEPECGQSE